MLLLLVFILVIGGATFIEEIYDKSTADLLIYNATWFEFFMGLFIVIYLFISYKRRLFRKEKLPQFIFHSSFVFIILGGIVTRHYGYQAYMHIIEKESVNTIYTIEPYLQIRTQDGSVSFVSEKPLHLSQIEKNSFHLEFELDGILEIDYKNFIARAEMAPNGTDHKLISGNNDSNPDVLIVTIIYQGQSYEAMLLYDKTMYTQKFKAFQFGDLTLEMVYGPKPIKMPFSLLLNKFTLTNYPGTDIPSYSESDVLLIDDQIGLKKSHLIYKNHVLDYEGYRFFQTSYDENQQGTILSVNYDYYGTRITYFGYFLMALGALLILFSNRTYYTQLNKKIRDVRARRKTLLLLLLLALSLFQNTHAQVANPISSEHADRFGHMIVQTYDGRFSSVHSLATDVIHKISGKNQIKTEEKGTMKPMQLFLDILVDPEYWKNQKIIVVREPSLKSILGISGKHASFYDFSAKSDELKALNEKAFKKNAADQSNFDREIIKVSERISIFLMIINGTSLKLFPEQNSANYNWLSWDEKAAFIPIQGDLLTLNRDLQLPEFSYSNIMRAYLISTVQARRTQDYSNSNKILGYIKHIQRQLTPEELMPSESKLNLEVIYNKLNIFDYLKYLYALLGVFLLTFTLIQNFKTNPNNFINSTIKIGIGIYFTAFIIQTIGMGLRWYLGGHAPWSNGYEVILLAAWGTVIAGFSVLNFSKISLAATALVTAVLLMVAGLSYYDPQLTNLNPVLKSYWLIIHVAIITIGYGFLALSFMLGLINIILSLASTKKKEKLFSLAIEELTYINEKLVTIGMLLVAVGTYIGCVWANESWGTYWSWNAKQVWSLIIVLAYGLILHFKYIPKLNSFLAFNIGSVVSFSSVLMTFIGVNYYFTKGLHRYATDDPPIFPVWAWVTVLSFLILMLAAIFKSYNASRLEENRS
ncbi:cytochrome c biogenesis protein [Aestuariivivens sp. NBU2969]|uniref:cytochrome c biogenesis protein n=1 Tax=Aestuariivivens sp. NBU2969 TaxID=2873267 RepID=UPI001CC00A07|nr:cytochrome c biogenesis protein CcsA [Aestuariivivens sp. NBU2969]